MKETENILANSLYLGIDIGGTHTVFAIVGPKGKILCRGGIRTTDYPVLFDFAKALRKSVEALAREAGINITCIGGIGVGAPCVNALTGVAEGAVDLPWPSPVPLAETLQNVFGIPVGAANDANAAAMGEMYYGACMDYDDFIMITLGTGVGSAIVADGNMILGKRALAGELGHSIVRYDSDRMCSCGRRGCLEMYCSARGVVLTARKMLEATKEDSSLRSIPSDTLSAKDICLAASAGDKIAMDTMRFTGEILGEACANFTAFSSPEAFVFFGGVARAFPYFKDAMIESYRRNLLWVYRDQVKFLQSDLPFDDAALLGAAAVGRRAALKTFCPTC